MSHRLTLNYVSPLPPAQTDIANFSARLLPALARLADVTAWTAQPETPDEIAGVPVRRFAGGIDAAALNDADLTIFNLGNHPDFHRDIYEVSARCPGLVILHDTRLQHFFAALGGPFGRPRRRYYADMAAHYGVEAVAAAQAYFAQTGPLDVLVDNYPLTAHAIANALAAVIHDPGQLDALRAATPVPVFCLPLAFDTAGLAPPAPRPAAEPYRLIVFGYLHDNRRLPSILDALAGLDGRDRFRLDIFGIVNDETGVRRRIAALGLGDLVALRGWVPAAELEAALAAADLAINLRFPTMGEASGSQLRIWSHGLPSLVTRVGWYANLPDDAVFFVTPDNEIADIRRHLIGFAGDPARYRAAGRRGYDILVAQHDCARYAQSLVDIAAERHALHRRRGAIDFARRAAIGIAGIAEGEGAAALGATVASRIDELMAP